MLKESVNCLVCGSNQSVFIGSGIDVEFKTSNDEWKTFMCVGCGHYYLNPRPALVESNSIYPDDYYPAISLVTKSEKIIGKLRRFIDRRKFSFFLKTDCKNLCLVDIGCGDGRLLATLRRNFPGGCRLIGVDFLIDPQTQIFFKKHNIEYISGLMENINLQLHDVSADLVIMTQVIEHLWQPNLILDNISKILKKDGFLLIETPNPESFCKRFQGGKYWGGWHRPRHLNLFTKNSMFELANKHGYKVHGYKEITVPAFWIMGFRNYLGITSKDESSFLSRTLSLKSVWALSFFTIVEFLSGVFKAGRSNHQFILAKK